MRLSVTTLLAMWLAIGTPAAVSTARLDRVAAAVIVWLTGPFAWWARALAKHHHDAEKTRAYERRFLIKV